MSTQLEGERAELERDLTALWVAKLNKSPIGRHDNFFELGGDSLTAADLLMDVYLKLNREVDAWVLFMRPTVAELAEAILSGDQAAPQDQ